MGGFSLKALLLFSNGRGYTCGWAWKREPGGSLPSCCRVRLAAGTVRPCPQLVSLADALAWHFCSFLRSAVFFILSCSLPFSSCLVVCEKRDLHNDGKIKSEACQREPACRFDRLQGPQKWCRDCKGFGFAQAGARPRASRGWFSGAQRPPASHSRTCFERGRWRRVLL